MVPGHVEVVVRISCYVEGRMIWLFACRWHLGLENFGGVLHMWAPKLQGLRPGGSDVHKRPALGTRTWHPHLVPIVYLST